MPDSFLHRVLSDLRSRGAGSDRVRLVFPSTRVLIAFRSISRGYAPEMLTMSRLMREMSRLKKADGLDLTFSVYSSYCDVCRRRDIAPLAFEQFYPWGQMMLSDFNDIDLAMGDADSIFRDTQNVKAIDSGQFADSAMIEELKEYFSYFEQAADDSMRGRYRMMWDLLGDIYHDLRDRCSAEGLAYDGAIYRRGAERAAERCPEGRFVFIGFCRLSLAEKALMQSLRAAGQASFYWDDLAPFICHEGSKAAALISDNISAFGNSLPAAEAAPGPDIEIISTSTRSSEAAFVRQWLDSVAVRGDSTTAIVLPDETLLPMLSHVLRLERYDTLFHAPVTGTATYAEIMRALQGRIADGTMGSADDVLAFLHDTIGRLKPEEDSADFTRESEAYRMATEAMTQTEALVHGHSDAAVSARGVVMLFQSILRRVDMHAAGDEDDEEPASAPSSRIAILTLDETQALDYDNILVIGCEEGSLPAFSRTETMLPDVVRLSWNIPLRSSRSFTDAYLFYRLLKLPARATLIYSSASTGIGKGEVSRFLLQLMAGWTVRGVRKFTLGCAYDQMDAGGIDSVPKSREMLQGLRSIEPTAMTLYMECPLKFYFSKVASMREPEPLAQKMPANLFGTLFHAAMQYYYEQKPATLITRDTIAYDLKEPGAAYLNRCIDRSFTENKVEDSPILRDIILRLMREVLRYDMKITPFTIQPDLIEKFIYTEVRTRCGNNEIAVRIGGKFDRVHTTNGDAYTVVDYKTSTWKEALKASSLDAVFNTPAKVEHFNYIIQTLLYCLALKDHLTERGIRFTSIKPELYFINGMSSPLFSPSITIDKEEVVNIGPYERSLRGYFGSIVDSIFDLNEPFEATPGKDQCKYCPYSMLCSAAVKK